MREKNVRRGHRILPLFPVADFHRADRERERKRESSASSCMPTSISRSVDEPLCSFSLVLQFVCFSFLRIRGALDLYLDR